MSVGNWEKCSTRNMNENGELGAVDCAAHSRITSLRRPLDSDVGVQGLEQK